MPKYIGAQLRVAVDAEAADDEPLEVAGEEVGQVERAGLVVGQRANVGAAGEELVAVGAGQALDALVGEDRVEQAAGAAVGVGDEDPLVAVARAARIRVADGARGCRRAGCGASGGRQATSTSGQAARSASTSSRASAPQPMTRTRGGIRASAVVAVLRRRGHGARRSGGGPSRRRRPASRQ